MGDFNLASKGFIITPCGPAGGAALVNPKLDVCALRRRELIVISDARGYSSTGSALSLRLNARVSSNEPIDLSARWRFRVDTCLSTVLGIFLICSRSGRRVTPGDKSDDEACDES